MSAFAGSIDHALAEQQFRDCAMRFGIALPGRLQSHKRYRFNPETGNAGKGSGWCVFYADGWPAGAFGDWRTGISEKWHAAPEAGRVLSRAEKAACTKSIKAIQRDREFETLRRQKEVAKETAALVKQATLATDQYPYLLGKGVRAHGLLLHDSKLIVPLHDADGAIHSYQTIGAGGEKLYAAGGRVEACFHLIGGKIDPEGENVIGEGFATMAAVHEATGLSSVAAMHAGNILAAAKALRAKYPKACFIFCADHDAWTNGNPGESKAIEAARVVGGKVAVPQFAGLRAYGATDFNDLAKAEGLETVKRCIEAARAPETGPGPETKTGTHGNGANIDGGEWRERTGGDAADPAPAFSDEALALRFANERTCDLRYAAAWNKWLRYDGARWRMDETLLAFDLVRALCRKVASGCNDRKKADALTGAKTVAAVTSLARADRRIAATVGQWDADPWLLNTPAGTVDLRNGKLRPHCAGDYMRKMTAVAPDPCCLTPLWLAFLERIMDADADLIGYLQRVAGYSLTGDNSEEAIFFGYGTGANGKGVFTGAFSGCLGEYHEAAPVETFTETHGERHPTELAGLCGARFVTATETQQGKRWDEAKIKALTGGDPISARFMRQDFFQFIPQLKLFISGNHKPSLRNVDEAMRRRFHLIPFAVTIPKSERDKELKAKLKAEWPGILAWAVRGCLDWQENGLNPPRAVFAATEAYLDAQDSFGAWVEECCELGANLCELRSQLWASWRGWAERSNEYTGKKSEFWEKLEASGMEPRRENYGQVYYGLKLK